ncbi:MAG: DUF624 domain-containing protein [Actinoplanes sp.]
MSAVTARPEFGSGPLTRAAALIYTLLTAGLLFLLTAGPGLAVLVLLSRDASNLPLVAACSLPIGPAASAVLSTLHRHHGDLADLRPARAFWRGYRANLRGVLSVWLPLLAWLTVLAVNLTHLGAAGLPGWWVAPLALVTAVALLWGGNALVIHSLFAFQARDVARLAGHYLTRTPSVTLGALGLLAVAACVTAVWSEAVLMLLFPVFALALLRVSRPMIDDLRKEFTA